VGGVAGIILAQLILWWAPFNLSVANRDLTGFGRKYGHYVPFLVPDSVHGGSSAGASGTEFSAQGGADSRASSSRPPTVGDYHFAESNLQNGGRESDSTSDARNGAADRFDDGAHGAVATGGGRDADELVDDLLEDYSGATDLPPLDSLLPNGDGASAPAANEELAMDPLRGREGAALELETPLPPTSNRLDVEMQEPASLPGTVDLAPKELASRHLAALRAKAALDSAVDPGRPTRQDVANFYKSFAALGEILPTIDRGDEVVARQIQEVTRLLYDVSREPTTLQTVGTVTPSWLANTQPHNGVFLYGRVQSTEQQGPFFETRLQLASPNPLSVHVLTTADPRPHFQTGTSVLVLGAIVDASSSMIGGYTGSAEQVILDGLHYAWQAGDESQ
jgi:hypothetical protein